MVLICGRQTCCNLVFLVPILGLRQTPDIWPHRTPASHILSSYLRTTILFPHQANYYADAAFRTLGDLSSRTVRLSKLSYAMASIHLFMHGYRGIHPLYRRKDTEPHLHWDQWCTTVPQAGRQTLRFPDAWTDDGRRIIILSTPRDDPRRIGWRTLSRVEHPPYESTDTVWLIIIVPTDWDGLMQEQIIPEWNSISSLVRLAKIFSYSHFIRPSLLYYPIRLATV